MEINERINYISKIAFNFDFSAYLANESKSLLVFQIDSINKSYSLISGYDDDNFLGYANSNYWHSMAGYRVDAHKLINKKNPRDVLLLANSILNSNPFHLDAIIIHEITHLLIDTNNFNYITIYPFIDELAKKLFNATDIEIIEFTKHDIFFCQLLIYGCSNYQSKTNNFKNLHETVVSAMKYDTIREYSL